MSEQHGELIITVNAGSSSIKIGLFTGHLVRQERAEANSRVIVRDRVGDEHEHDRLRHHRPGHPAEPLRKTRSRADDRKVASWPPRSTTASS